MCTPARMRSPAPLAARFRIAAAQCSARRRAVEGREQPVPGCRDLTSAVTLELRHARRRGAPRGADRQRPSPSSRRAIAVESTRSVKRSVASTRLWIPVGKPAQARTSRHSICTHGSSPTVIAVVSGRDRRRRRRARTRPRCRPETDSEPARDRSNADVTRLAPLAADGRAYVHRPAPARLGSRAHRPSCRRARPRGPHARELDDARPAARSSCSASRPQISAR